MAKYKVRIGKRAEADLLSIPFPFRRQIHQRILKFSHDPRPEGWESVGSGENAVFLLRGYELYYAVSDTDESVTVIAILPLTPND